jgi:manganese/zinc/iron transport system permease protein
MPGRKAQMTQQSLIELLAGNGGFNTTSVMIGALFLGIAAGIVGSLVLLRDRALIGDALAHGTLPGIAGAFLLAVLAGYEQKSSIILLLGATFTGILAILAVHLIVQCTRLTEDTAIGIVLSTFFGAGVTMLSFLQQFGRGNVAGLNHFIYGQAAAMQRGDVLIISIIAILATILALFLFKEFRLLCFDEDFAKSQGWPVNRLDLVLMGLVVLVVVAGLQAVGMILVIALLIIPPAAARLWTEKMSSMTFLSSIIGGASGYIGAALSATYPNLPAGSIIVLTTSAVFAVSLLFAPTRGLVSRTLKVARLRLQVAEDHLLLEAYEYLANRGELARDTTINTSTLPEDTISPRCVVPFQALPIIQLWSTLKRNIVVLWGKSRNMYRFDETEAQLQITARGLKRISALADSHVTWEEKLLHHPDVDQSLAHTAADYVEHLRLNDNNPSSK